MVVDLVCVHFFVCMCVNGCVSTCCICVPLCVTVSLSAHHVDSSDKRRSESTKDKKTEMTAGKRVGVNKQGNRWRTEEREIKGDRKQRARDRGKESKETRMLKKRRWRKGDQRCLEHRREAHSAVNPETEREEVNIREKRRTGGNNSLLSDPHGTNTYSTHCLGQNTTKPLNHKNIAAKPADPQGIIWYRGHQGTQRMKDEALPMHKTEQAVDTWPRKCHSYYKPSPHRPGQWLRDQLG